MGRQVARQPNGLYAIWSSIVDDFILENATEQEIRDWWTRESVRAATEKAIHDMDEAFDSIEKYGYDTWGQTYEDFAELRDIVHMKNDDVGSEE